MLRLVFIGFIGCEESEEIKLKELRLFLPVEIKAEVWEELRCLTFTGSRMLILTRPVLKLGRFGHFLVAATCGMQAPVS